MAEIKNKRKRKSAKKGAVNPVISDPQNKGGRPSIFSREIGDEICRRMSAGESLKKICEDENMPCRATVNVWRIQAANKDATEEKKEFLDKYEIASNDRAERMFDELEEIADNGENDWIKKSNGARMLNKEAVMRSRLRVDVRKWYLSKIMPKKYGEKIDITSKGEKLAQPNAIVFVDFSGKKDENAES